MTWEVARSLVAARRDGHQWNNVQEGASFSNLTWRETASSFDQWIHAVAKISGVLLRAVTTWGRTVHKKVGVHFPVLPETCNMAFQHLICLLHWHQCKVPWWKLGVWRKLASWTPKRRTLCDFFVLPSSSIRSVQDAVPQLGLQQTSIQLGPFPLLVSLPLMPNTVLFYSGFHNGSPNKALYFLFIMVEAEMTA